MDECEFNVIISYAGSVLVKVKAKDETKAKQKAEDKVGMMDNETFLSELEPQRTDIEVRPLCVKCGCDLYQRGQRLCNDCKGK